MAYVVLARWTAKDGQVERIRKILETMTPLSRAEPKVLEYQVHTSEEDPRVFVLYERYTDASGYVDHRATEAFQTHVLGEAIPNLEDRKVEILETID